MGILRIVLGVWLERLARYLNGNIGPEALMRALG